MVRLFDNFRISTTGATGASNVYSRTDILVPGLADKLLQAEDVTLVTLQVSGPPDNELEWNVELIPGYDRDHESTAFTPTSTDVNADGTIRGTAYTTTTNFLPHVRACIRCKNENTVSGVRTALGSSMLLIRLAGQ